MGLISILQSFTRVANMLVGNPVYTSVVKLNPDGGSNITATHFSSPGDDSFPIETDTVITTSIQGTGKQGAVGYADTKNEPKALKGDKRIYGRDTDGVEVNNVWLKNDGTILIENANGSSVILPTGEIFSTNAGGSVQLKPNGELNASANTEINLTAPDIILNGNLQVNGTIIATGDIISGLITLLTHKHPIAGGSSAPGPTGTPVP